MTAQTQSLRVLVTGASGFVGRYLVGELLRRGHHVVALARSEEKLRRVVPEVEHAALSSVRGGLFDRQALGRGVEGADAAVHLVGIIAEKGCGQTFDRIHREGTERVVEALVEGGVRRYVHMSALGTRAGARSLYHRTKWAAEQAVGGSPLESTVFRPSLIHGPDGEFMRLLKRLACGLLPPVMPYFGSGRSRVQPVSVRDVAFCFADALERPATVGQVYELGGPKTYTWRELYATAQRLIPGARRWKPRVGQPVALARLLAATVMKTPLVPQELRFNRSQIQMSQEDSTCDHTVVERAFDLRLRDFQTELAAYATEIP